ncbi:MAG: asparagine--tRNA ligase [Candidatus Diapherotrites archaeon]|nr:asparagine--tRNA ligase [Candidatus Diapherotrites archaeon]
MKFEEIRKVPDYDGKKIALRGWVYRHRAGKGVVFIVLRDSTGTVQCTAKGKEYEKAEPLLIESAITIEGTVKKDERAPGGYEVQVDKLGIVHAAERFPITKDQSKEFLRDVRHLWVRSQPMAATLKIRSTVFGAIDDFFRDRGYYEFQSPIFTMTAAEGGSTLFEVDYFGKKAFLAQTWQLYAEAAIFGLEKIYTIAPSFRAEKSSTSRHLTEFWHAEVETAWQDFDALQKQGEELVSFIVQRVLEGHRAELEILGVDIKALEKVKPPFPRLTYKEALEKLEKHGMKVPYGKDLRTKEEKKLCAMYGKPVIVTHYPKEVKAFYMKEAPGDTVLGFDMLVPHVGEIIGGSERETSIEELEKRLAKEGETFEDYGFYMDTRKYGSVPHSGLGLGIDRVVQWICGLDSIHEAIGFPRTMDRISP